MSQLAKKQKREHRSAGANDVGNNRTKLQQQESCPILRLPYDLSVLIWKEIVAPTGLIMVHRHRMGRSAKEIAYEFYPGVMQSRKKEFFQTSILLTCKQIYQELSFVFYTCNEFHFQANARSALRRFLSIEGFLKVKREIPLNIRHYVDWESYMDENDMKIIFTSIENFIRDGGKIASFTMQSTPYHSLQRETPFKYVDMRQVIKNCDESSATQVGLAIDRNTPRYKDQNRNLFWNWLYLLRELASTLDIKPGVNGWIDNAINNWEAGRDMDNPSKEQFRSFYEDFRCRFRDHLSVNGKLCNQTKASTLVSSSHSQTQTSWLAHQMHAFMIIQLYMGEPLQTRLLIPRHMGSPLLEPPIAPRPDGTENSLLFQKLPLEVRQMIWREVAAPTQYVVVDWTDKERGWDWTAHRRSVNYSTYLIHEDEADCEPEGDFDDSIVPTCKKMYDEISDVFYKDNEFLFDGYDQMCLRGFLSLNGHIKPNIGLRIRCQFQQDCLVYTNCPYSCSPGDYCYYCHEAEKCQGIILYTEQFLRDGGRLASFAFEWQLNAQNLAFVLATRSGLNTAPLTPPLLLLPEWYADYDGNLHQDYLSVLRDVAKLLSPVACPLVSSQEDPEADLLRPEHEDCRKRFDVVVREPEELFVMDENTRDALLEMFAEFHQAFGADLYVDSELCYRDGTRIYEPFQDRVLRARRPASK